MASQAADVPTSDVEPQIVPHLAALGQPVCTTTNRTAAVIKAVLHLVVLHKRMVICFELTTHWPLSVDGLSWREVCARSPANKRNAILMSSFRPSSLLFTERPFRNDPCHMSYSMLTEYACHVWRCKKMKLRRWRTDAWSREEAAEGAVAAGGALSGNRLLIAAMCGNLAVVND